MRNLYFFLFIFLIQLPRLFGQGNFQIVYPNNHWDAYAKQSMDGNYIVSIAKDSLLFKMDSTTHELWQKSFHIAIDNFKTDPKGRIWCGGVSPAMYSHDANMMLLDSAGNLIWNRKFFSTYSGARVIEEKINDSGNGYFLLIDDVPGLSNAYYLYNLDELNDSIAYVSPFQTDFCFMYDHMIASITTNQYSLIFEIEKHDTTGNLIWTKTIADTLSGSFGEYSARKIIQDKDSTLLISGYYRPNSNTLIGMIMRFDQNTGDTLSSKYYNQRNFTSFITTSDRGYAALSNDSSAINLCKFDSSLNVTWVKNFTGLGYADGYSLEETTDQGFLIGGSTSSVPAVLDSTFSYVIKTDSLGNTGQLSTSIHQLKKADTFSIYPNPFQTNGRLSTSLSGPASMQIFNQMGQIAGVRQIDLCNAIIDRNKLPDGLYYFRIIRKDEIIYSGKFIVN